MKRSRSRPARPRAAISWRIQILALLAVALFGVAGLVVAQDRIVTSPISIEQDQLAAGAYSKAQVLGAGRQFFAAPFVPDDGHGEGDNGPRSGQRLALWEVPPGVAEPPPINPFLRVNGIDSQSCFECHNSAGTVVPSGEIGLDRKNGGVGGAAGFGSVLFGNEDFPEPITHIVRAAPKSFGTAYVQELALEMTRILQEIEQDAIDEASQNPGIQVTKSLVAKGVDFGSITIICSSSSCATPYRNTTNVVGVSKEDLIVRPFQHKGVAATLRSFTKTALDFHFSVQPVEVVGRNNDCDLDGLINEMAVNVLSPAASNATVQVQQSLGNVAALSAFAGMLRPPVTNTALTKQQARGKYLFTSTGCADCHVPTLDTRPRPQFRIELAEPAPRCPPNSGYSRLGSFAEIDSAEHPAKEATREQQEAEDAALAQQSATKAGTLQQAAIFEQVDICPNGFYCIPLNSSSGLTDEFLPRLPVNGDRTVTVPLYSDLKRHDMGAFLAQVSPQQADDVGTPIENEEWLTTKLWGVADNGPWLHDGRARTLDEAIVMHSGRNGTATDSDASTVIGNYLGLSTSDQKALVAFLETLSVPATP